MEFWEGVYSGKVRELPWYLPGLDGDVGRYLTSHRIRKGRLLDIGAGPGTQAAALAKRGFEVTATDISRTAVEKASLRFPHVRFIQDDILESRLSGEFDVILDRGCFHVLPPEKRKSYVVQIRSLLAPKGVLLLKCFSDRQPGTEGPYRLSESELRAQFGDFEIEELCHTRFEGTLREKPHALFMACRRRKTNRATAALRKISAIPAR